MKGSYLNDAFFSRLETLALELRPNLAGFFGGKHKVSTYGQTVEFADYREYQLGDDIRRIDWNLYSRFEKYFLKLFTDERQMHTQVFIDCSASMGKDNPEKANYAVAIAAALGYLSVHNMDKVSFKLVKGEKVTDGEILGLQPDNPKARAVFTQLTGVQFPEGKLSIKSTIGEIYANEEAWAFFSGLTGGKLGPDMPMWGMMQNFNLEMMMTMMGNAPESALKAINKKLNAFDLIG